MKRFLFLIHLILFTNIFSQTNKIIISNHRSSPIYFYLGANTRSNLGPDCVPLAESTQIAVLQPQSEVFYKTINNALSSNPSINNWKIIEIPIVSNIDLSLGQQASNDITNFTEWSQIKFYIVDPAINPNAVAYYLGPWCAVNPLPSQYSISITGMNAEWTDTGEVNVIIN
jgi:hypothetical protein